MSKRKRGQPRNYLGVSMTRADQSVLASLVGMTTLTVGVSKRKIKSQEQFWEIVNAMFGMKPHDGEDFIVAVRRIRNAIRKIPADDRKTARESGAAKLGYYRPSLKLVESSGKPKADQAVTSAAKREAFYLSWEWRRLRMKVIKQYDRRCMCCGASPEDTSVGGYRVRLVVDHIKPLSKNWNLRLDPANLQILCDECNMGKGAWDETDHRSESERLIAEQLRYVA